MFIETLVLDGAGPGFTGGPVLACNYHVLRSTGWLRKWQFSIFVTSFSRELENATKMNNKYLIHHSSLMGEQLIQDKTGYIFPQDQIKCEILY